MCFSSYYVGLSNYPHFPTTLDFSQNTKVIMMWLQLCSCCMAKSFTLQELVKKVYHFFAFITLVKNGKHLVISHMVVGNSTASFIKKNIDIFKNESTIINRPFCISAIHIFRLPRQVGSLYFSMDLD